jgi:hypothetical protein
LPLERCVKKLHRPRVPNGRRNDKRKEGVAGKDSLQSRESIEEAYEAFSKDESERLIALCNKEDLKALSRQVLADGDACADR